MSLPFRLIIVAKMLVATAALASTLAKPGCDDRCGDVEIPYPFGMSSGCFINDDFFINCSNIFNPPKPYLWNSTYIVNEITVEGQLRINAMVSKHCPESSNESYGDSPQYDLLEFAISNTQNKFTVIGCNGFAFIEGTLGYRKYQTGCMSLCGNITYVDDGACTGTGCCQIDIPKGQKHFKFTAFSFGNSTDVSPCTYALVAEESQFNFKSSYLSDNLTENFTMLLDWSITRNGNCEEAKSSPDYACKDNAECYQPEGISSGYRCKCRDGYQGNPYLFNGCQDIDECKSSIHNCTHKCVNVNGSYHCKCPKGYHGNGKKGETGCKPDRFPVVTVVVPGFVVLLVSVSWFYLVLKKRKLIKMKEKFFHQNGGFILQQKLSKQNGSSNAAKIFTEGELKKATGNYAEGAIIGRGGFGIVYKGFLADNSPVAIKMSKIVDQSQIEQFVNEVVVLSQINHRNVVRLLGCCLETEVPLLVYEFVSNGTLFDHIHNKDKAPSMSWETRLRIAAETAGVLSYLHSAAATPIIHRDVKSTNILLDHNYTAKVSDFGASKLVPMDVTQLSTMVQGTLGYLDPEYLHTSQLTEKSDVYSFGVVLVELLTGRKAILFDRPEEERSLVMYFITSLKTDCLFKILDDHVARDGNEEQLKQVAELARMCLKMKGEERPTMREVAMELDGLRMTGKHSSDNDELNPEKEECFFFVTSDSQPSGNGINTRTAGYDSIRNQVQVVIDDQR